MKRNLAIGLGVVLLLAAGAVLAAHFYAAGQAGTQAEALFAQLPPGVAAKHGAVSYSLLGDRLVVEDVTLDTQSRWLHSFHFGRMTVSGVNHGMLGALAERGPDNGGSFSAGEIVLDGVDYDVGDGYHQAVEWIVLHEPRLDNPDRTPVEQWTLAQWIAALSLASAEATNLRGSLDDKASGAKLEFQHASRSISGLKAGRLASVVDKAVVVLRRPRQDGDHDGSGSFLTSDTIRIEIAETRAVDADLLGWEKVFNPGNYGDAPRDPTYYTLFGSVDASGITTLQQGSDTPVTVSIDALSMTGIKMRQWPFPPGAAPLQPSVAQAMELLQSFSLDGIELKKLSVSPQDTAVPASFSLGGVMLKGGPGRLEHAEIADLAVKVRDTSFTLGALELDGLVIRLPEGFFTIDPSDWATHPPGMPRVFFDRYRLAGLAFQYPLVGQVSLKELAVAMAGTIDRPTHGRLDMEELGIDFGALGQLPPMAKFGYGQVFFAAHGEADYDTDAKTLELKHFAFGAPEMGTLSMAYRFGNYAYDGTAAGAEAMQQKLREVVIERAELRYDDASLFEHILGVVAGNTGRTPEATRQAAIDMLEQRRSAHAGAPLVREALGEMIGFVREPKSIRLTIAPPRPITFGQLSQLGQSQPNENMELLGIKVDRP